MVPAAAAAAARDRGAPRSAEREELFTAWRRFLEGIAEERPTVLVFEDLHWADEALLAFLEHLADLAEGVPLLLVGTARPELFERHPDYAAGLRNATPINLAPLSQEETARLVSALLESTVIPAELQQPILDRAGGNPLYAEEFVRLLKDRDLLVRKGSSWELREGAEVPFPESVQALIAARLDTLEPEAKSLLADAAVIGKVFWAGAVAAMGERDPQTVTTTLRELSRKELVRPARQSSMAGEAEYAFWHILARDVAYNQLPRASRADRHVAAATWIESKAPERVEDLADVLAYHYATALELAHAAGQTEQADRAGGTRPAVPRPGRGTRPRPRHRCRPGELRAGARPSPRQGTPNGPPRWHGSARPPSTPDATARRTRRWRRRSPRSRRQARFAPPPGRWARSATCSTGSGIRRRGSCPPQAVALLEPLPPGPELVGALTELARAEALQGRNEAGLGYAEQALALAEELGLAAARPRPRLPRPGPQQPRRPRRARRLPRGDHARHRGRAGPRGRPPSQQPRGVALWPVEGPVARLEVLRAGIAFAQARGLTEMADVLTASTLDALVETGEHEQALALASELAARYEASGNVLDLTTVRSRAGPDPDPARAGSPGGRHARLARNHHPRGRRHRLHRRQPGRGRLRPRRARTARPGRRPAHRDRSHPRQPREPELRRLPARRWCEPPSRSATRNSPSGSQPGSSPAPPTTSTPSPR